MREILFRGKTVRTRLWVYGNYQHTDCDTKYNDYIGQNKIDCPVIPKTVCQYTGLVDKNGVKIFENDIIYNEVNDENYLVIYENGAFGVWGIQKDTVCEEKFIFDGDCWGESADIDTLDCKDSAVVGNKFDNPELLEGKE